MSIRLSDKHFVCSLANVFEMLSPLGFNVSMFIMFIWSLPVAVPFFISRSAAFVSTFAPTFAFAVFSLPYVSI